MIKCTPLKITTVALGCRVNQYELESVTERIEKLGAVRSRKASDCDICIVNTCAVTEEAVRKSRQTVRRLIKNNPNAFVAVMGCASQLDAESFADIDGVSYVCGTRNKLSVIDAVKNYIDGINFKKINITEPTGECEKENVLSFERTRAYIKIEDGCDGNCSYCVITKVRGDVAVRNKDDILSEIKNLAENGCHEVVLTGIETSAYGKDLSGLIKDVSEIKGIERIRLGSMEPSFLKKDFIDAVSGIPQFCHHFHISVQSGSSSVLAKMRRKYNRAQLVKNIEYIKEKIPDCNFTCDIIVGFPGETDEDFNDTVSLVESVGFLHCHIFRYSKRPGTDAAVMDCQVSPEISEKRLKNLEDCAMKSKMRVLENAVKTHDTLELLCETQDKEGYITGHTDSFMECRVKPMGKFVKGKIIRFKPVSVGDGLILGDEIND